MILHRTAGTTARVALASTLALALAGCGAFGSGGSGGSGLFGGGGGGGLFGGGNREARVVAPADPLAAPDERPRIRATREQQQESRFTSIFDVFSGSADPNTTVEVNKYIWTAAQEVLNFLPIEQVDPFTGVLVTGYGTPPGGGRAYRATVYVQDPALDARSLKIALQSRGGGAVAPETVRAVEDAILTRARELRIRDGRL